jgi:hypothetical protein
MKVRVLALFLLAAPAFAGSATDGSQARAFFNAGASAYAKGRYEEAVSQFEEAYRILPKPAILFSLAQAERRHFYASGREQVVLRKAIAHYEQYLKEVPVGERREDATTALGELSPQLRQGDERAALAGPAIDLAKARLTVSVATESARIALDDAAPVDAPLIVETTPGKHKVRVVAEGFVNVVQDVVCEGGRRTALEVPMQEKPGQLELVTNRSADVYVDGRLLGQTSQNARLDVPAGIHIVSLSSNGSPLASEEMRIERGKLLRRELRLRDSTQRTLSYVTLSAGAVGLIGATVLTLGALGQENKAKDLLAKQERGTLDSDGLSNYARAIDRRDNLRTGAWVALGVSAGFLALGVGLFVFDKPSPTLTTAKPSEPPPATKRTDIEAKRATPRLVLVPWATNEQGGASLFGSF